MSVERLPVRFKRRKLISPREMWDAPEPSDLMVWEICPYVQGPDGYELGCQGCPAWEQTGKPCPVEGCSDPTHGAIKRMCRGLAEEVCKIILAAQWKESAP